MGGTMIKNIIILSLILVIVTGMSGADFLDILLLDLTNYKK